MAIYLKVVVLFHWMSACCYLLMALQERPDNHQSHLGTMDMCAEFNVNPPNNWQNIISGSPKSVLSTGTHESLHNTHYNIHNFMKNLSDSCRYFSLWWTNGLTDRQTEIVIPWAKTDIFSCVESVLLLNQQPNWAWPESTLLNVLHLTATQTLIGLHFTDYGCCSDYLPMIYDKPEGEGCVFGDKQQTMVFIWFPQRFSPGISNTSKLLPATLKETPEIQQGVKMNKSSMQIITVFQYLQNYYQPLRYSRKATPWQFCSPNSWLQTPRLWEDCKGTTFAVRQKAPQWTLCFVCETTWKKQRKIQLEGA